MITWRKRFDIFDSIISVEYVSNKFDPNIVQFIKEYPELSENATDIPFRMTKENKQGKTGMIKTKIRIDKYTYRIIMYLKTQVKQTIMDENTQKIYNQYQEIINLGNNIRDNFMKSFEFSSAFKILDCMCTMNFKHLEEQLKLSSGEMNIDIIREAIIEGYKINMEYINSQLTLMIEKLEEYKIQKYNKYITGIKKLMDQINIYLKSNIEIIAEVIPFIIIKKKQIKELYEKLYNDIQLSLDAGFVDTTIPEVVEQHNDYMNMIRSVYNLLKSDSLPLDKAYNISQGLYARLKSDYEINTYYSYEEYVNMMSEIIKEFDKLMELN